MWPILPNNINVLSYLPFFHTEILIIAMQTKATVYITIAYTDFHRPCVVVSLLDMLLV